MGTELTSPARSGRAGGLSSPLSECTETNPYRKNSGGPDCDDPLITWRRVLEVFGALDGFVTLKEDTASDRLG